jgi:hypothetical protein
LPNGERRRTQRFCFELPLIVRWAAGSQGREEQTSSQDVSVGGVYFFLLTQIPDGTPIELEMTLPSQITLGSPLRVRCHGKVRRCEIKADGTVGMAAAVEKYEFLPDTPRAV